MIIGLGIDVADLSRFEFDAKRRERFARKVFTLEEMAHALRHRYAAPRLAGAFAAKEAARKAFGHAIPWRSVGVRHEASGRPFIELRGAAYALVAARRIRRIHLSISHSRTSAIATVILESDDPAGGIIAAPAELAMEAAR